MLKVKIVQCTQYIEAGTQTKANFNFNKQCGGVRGLPKDRPLLQRAVLSCSWVAKRQDREAHAPTRYSPEVIMHTYQKRHSIEAKETYYSSKRDLLCNSKRPTMQVEEAYYD